MSYDLDVRLGISKVVAESVYEWLLDSHWGWIDYPHWLIKYIHTYRFPNTTYIDTKRIIADLERILICG